MIETENQRRWWFATHPEFGRRGSGARSGGHDDDEENEKISPADVVDYVNESLKHVTDPIVIALLESLKRQVEGQGASEAYDQRLAFSDPPDPGSESQTATDQSGTGERDPNFWDAVTKGIDNTLQDWKRWASILAARLPGKGTPERREIERARQQGIRAKRKQELADIKAGGKGSGVWTEEELKGIRETGEWPTDARWHHDPTVANRPDLAADPKSVRPVRGGTRGHLDEHGGNWRNPEK